MLVTLNLVRDRQETLQRQIFAQISNAILAGRLPPGTELPPSRVLASEYCISRNTVVQAYQWLAAEGYVETQRSARTIVSENLPEECLSVDRTDFAGWEIRHRSRPQKADVVFLGSATCIARSGIAAKENRFLARSTESEALSSAAGAEACADRAAVNCRSRFHRIWRRIRHARAAGGHCTASGNRARPASRPTSRSSSPPASKRH